MRWFGKTWGAPINEQGEHVETPVGEHCLDCGELIDVTDRGVMIAHQDAHQWVRFRPWHFRCLLRQILP